MFDPGISVAMRKHTAMILNEQGQIIPHAFGFTNDRSRVGEIGNIEHFPNLEDLVAFADIAPHGVPDRL